MLQIIIALIASLFTATQTFLLYTGRTGICFNEGCEIVERMTTVPPIFFNLAGTLYFQMIFWCLLWGRRESEGWTKFANILLLAGVTAEAVLVFFQHQIANAFCSYCLIILAAIVVLNLLSGFKQIFRGSVLFSAVIIACLSVQFGTGGGAGLGAGTIAFVKGSEGTLHHLIFSKTCPHCEEVIASLKENNSCTIAFNPIERNDEFQFEGVQFTQKYDSAANISFLRAMSMNTIPVLVVKKKEKTEILNGKLEILKYIDENCRTK